MSQPLPRPPPQAHQHSSVTLRLFFYVKYTFNLRELHIYAKLLTLSEKASSTAAMKLSAF